jgi:amino acid adenylation domain-containing protein
VREEGLLDRFKLKLVVERSGSELRFRFYYDGSRFDEANVRRIAGYYQTLLAAAVAHPETAVSRLPLLDVAERNRLLHQWNQTAAEYPHCCWHELFEAQAERTPERPALQFAERSLSYRELNQQANRLGHYLRSLGVGPDALVGLCLERSAEMMVAVLAILKAGGAYVPLNADNPKPRLAQQLSGAVALITEAKLLARMPDFAGPVLCLDRDQSRWAEQPATNPSTNTNPENLIYVIYTSGSTGVPKGVAVRHRNLVNYAHFIIRRLELERFPEGLHFATVSTLGADLGNTCIFPALISGGCLHVISYEVSTDSQRFASYCEHHPIDVLKIVPSHLQALLGASDAGAVLPRKYLITGGESLTAALIEKVESFHPGCELLNHYGPTETTVGSLTLRLKEFAKQSGGSSIPIGRPIANTQVYILDQHLEPVPVGVIGELYIAGAGVTAGYLNQAEKTAERFLPDPFSRTPEAKMYRTGDLARYREDGNVEFLGRGDDQVKIRGFRIELGEIEAVLGRHPGVKQAVVLVRQESDGEKRLVGYVVPRAEAAVTGEQLRSYLKEQLPDYMVPTAMVMLAKLPLNANGKIDRQALPAPEQAQSKTYVAPRTPTEEVLANIWCEVLRRDRISTHDNFFELGGHSLMATQIVSRVREQFKVELGLRVLFEKPTIAGLSEAVRNAQEAGAESEEPGIVPVRRESYRAGQS